VLAGAAEVRARPGLRGSGQDLQSPAACSAWKLQHFLLALPVQLDPVKAAGRTANVLSLEKLGPDRSMRQSVRIRVILLKVHGFNKAYGALHFLNGHK